MEKELLNSLYLNYSREICCYLYSLCHSWSMAEDLMQETFLKALVSLRDSHTNVRAWLYLVARNLCFNQMERNRKHIPLESLPDQPVADHTLERLIAAEERQLLYQGIQHLNCRAREVLTLQYFSQLSQKEIGRVMGLSSENVRVLAYRAKKQLKQYMEVHGYEIS